MATRATISVKHEDGSYSSIYNHYDGYESSLGEELKKHFTNQKDVEGLMDEGAIRGIYDGLVDPFNDGSICNRSKNRDEFTNYIDEEGYQYNYLFEDGEWKLI